MLKGPGPLPNEPPPLEGRLKRAIALSDAIRGPKPLGWALGPSSRNSDTEEQLKNLQFYYKSTYRNTYLGVLVFTDELSLVVALLSSEGAIMFFVYSICDQKIIK